MKSNKFRKKREEQHLRTIGILNVQMKLKNHFLIKNSNLNVEEKNTYFILLRFFLIDASLLYYFYFNFNNGIYQQKRLL